MDGGHTGERFGGHPEPNHNSHSATSSWPSDEPLPHNHRRNFYGDDGHHHNHHHHHRRYDHHSDQSHHHNSYSAANDPIVGSADSNSYHSTPFPGRKRPFSYLRQAPFSDGTEGGGYVKLYVAGIPRTATEEDISAVFGEHGFVLEVVLLKDKRTRQQQEFCFVKYATVEEANRAIGALSSQFTFPEGVVPIVVKYADGERERLGSFGEHTRKLYVGCVNRHASKGEIEEIFSPYGVVEDIYIVRDELKQQRGCAFVQFSCRDMAVAAINALHGTYIMRGCDQPLIVRFADPKKPRVGECRPAPYVGEPWGGRSLSNDAKPSLFVGSKPQTVSSTCAASEQILPSTASSAHSASLSTEVSDSVDCDWSEHICPDGNFYYYNCVTCESRWEKPEEFALYEQQLENLEQQQQQQQELLPQQQVTCTPGDSRMQQELYQVHIQTTRSPVVPPACV